jgi:hypothetical protein
MTLTRQHVERNKRCFGSFLEVSGKPRETYVNWSAIQCLKLTSLHVECEALVPDHREFVKNENSDRGTQI